LPSAKAQAAMLSELGFFLKKKKDFFERKKCGFVKGLLFRGNLSVFIDRLFLHVRVQQAPLSHCIPNNPLYQHHTIALLVDRGSRSLVHGGL
jgi:hypothetical protein